VGESAGVGVDVADSGSGIAAAAVVGFARVTAVEEDLETRGIAEADLYSGKPRPW
jgi:hypothetical protein